MRFLSQSLNYGPDGTTAMSPPGSNAKQQYTYPLRFDCGTEQMLCALYRHFDKDA